MTIAQMYIACDGTPFKNEAECLAYEETVKDKYQKEIYFLDSDGDEMPISEANYQACTWLIVYTMEAAQYLEREFGSELLPWTTPTVGIWKFDDNNGYWINAQDDIFSELETILKVKEFFYNNLKW